MKTNTTYFVLFLLYKIKIPRVFFSKLGTLFRLGNYVWKITSAKCPLLVVRQIFIAFLITFSHTWCVMPLTAPRLFCFKRWRFVGLLTSHWIVSTEKFRNYQIRWSWGPIYVTIENTLLNISIVSRTVWHELTKTALCLNSEIFY